MSSLFRTPSTLSQRPAWLAILLARRPNPAGSRVSLDAIIGSLADLVRAEDLFLWRALLRGQWRTLPYLFFGGTERSLPFFRAESPGTYFPVSVSRCVTTPRGSLGIVLPLVT